MELSPQKHKGLKEHRVILCDLCPFVADLSFRPSLSLHRHGLNGNCIAGADSQSPEELLGCYAALTLTIRNVRFGSSIHRESAVFRFLSAEVFVGQRCGRRDEVAFKHHRLPQRSVRAGEAEPAGILLRRGRNGAEWLIWLLAPAEAGVGLSRRVWASRNDGRQVTHDTFVNGPVRIDDPCALALLLKFEC